MTIDHQQKRILEVQQRTSAAKDSGYMTNDHQQKRILEVQQRTTTVDYLLKRILEVQQKIVSRRRYWRYNRRLSGEEDTGGTSTTGDHCPVVERDTISTTSSAEEDTGDKTRDNLLQN